MPNKDIYKEASRGFNRERYSHTKRSIEEQLRKTQGSQEEPLFKRSVNFVAAMLFREKLSAGIDKKTGLLNESAFLQRLEAYMALADREEFSIPVFYIDFKKFKFINDHFGHDEGDKALRLFADIIKKLIRGYDLASRLGGDEFGIAEIYPTYPAEFKTPGMLIKEFDLEKSRIKGGPNLGLSIGYAVYYGNMNKPPGEIVKRAEIAMRNAKLAPGTSTVPWYEGIYNPSDIELDRDR